MPRHLALRTLAFALAALLASGCSSLSRLLRGAVRKPTATMQKAELKDISLDSATVAATFRVNNPNAVGVSLAGVDFDFTLGARKLFDGRVENGLKLAANSSAEVVVPVKIPFTAIPDLLTTLATKKESPYRVDGKLGVQTPIGVVSIPLGWSGVLPIPSLPKVSLASAKVGDVSVSGAKVVLALDVENPNVFGLPLDALGGSLAVAGQNVARLGLSAARPLAAGSKTRVELPADISFLGAGLAVTQAVMNRSAQVKLTGEAKFAGRALPLDLATTLR